MPKIAGLLILGAAVYAALNVASLGLLVGLGGAVLGTAIGLAFISAR